MGVWHWILNFTGVHIPSNGSQWYNFWSGFGSDLGEVAIIGAVIQLVRQYNCHHKGCWRLSHHVTAKGYKLCKTHVALPESSLDLPAIHPDHLTSS